MVKKGAYPTNNDNKTHSGHKSGGYCEDWSARFRCRGYEKFHSEDGTGSGMLPQLIHGVDGALKRGSIERR